jgi:hypothetical protein
MMARIRYLVLALVVVVLLIGGVAYAYPWTLVSRYYAFQSTNPSISSNNAQGYLIQLPQCYISNNPYSGGGYTGATGTYGLINCVAINYGAISIVVWFYEPQNGQGMLLSSNQYLSGAPTSSYHLTPIYIGTNGYLYVGDWIGGSAWQLSPVPISPGWHMVVYEEWASSTSGPYYVSGYLDGRYLGQISSSTLPFMFGEASASLAYSVIGVGDGNAYPNAPNAWWWFNGTIAYVAVYNTVLSQSQVQALYQAGFPNELFAQNLVVAYLLVNNTAIYQGPNYVDYVIPWFVNNALLRQLNIINPSTFVIAPTGLPGLVPSSQFLGPIPTNLFSWCRLLQGVSVSVPSHVYVNQSFNVNVQLTTITQMQYELPYWFLVGINGTNESNVLSIDAWVFSSDAESAYTFVNSTTLVAPPKPGNYTITVSLPVCNMTWTKQITVDPPPSVNTTNSTSPPSPVTNSTSNTPPPPPPNTSGSSSSSSSSTSSSSSASTSTGTASTILTKLSVSLADALTTVTTYLANPVVIALLVLAIVAIAYIIYKKLTEVTIKL